MGWELVAAGPGWVWDQGGGWKWGGGEHWDPRGGVGLGPNWALLAVGPRARARRAHAFAAWRCQEASLLRCAHARAHHQPNPPTHPPNPPTHPHTHTPVLKKRRQSRRQTDDDDGR